METGERVIDVLTKFSKLLFCSDLDINIIKCDTKIKKNIFGTLKKIRKTNVWEMCILLFPEIS